MKTAYPRSRAEYDELASLLAGVFSGPYERARHRFLTELTKDPGVTPEQIRIVKKNGKIVAHVAYTRKTVKIGRATIEAGGIAGVACRQECRGKGLASSCIRDAVGHMSGQGIPLAILFGIDRFYTAFDFVGCIPSYAMKIGCREIPDLRQKLAVRPYAKKDLKALTALCEQAHSNTPLSVVRDAKRFAHAIDARHLGADGAIQVFADKRGAKQPRAYVVWTDGRPAEVGVAPGDQTACESVLSWIRDRRIQTLEKHVALEWLAPAHPLWRYCLRFNHTAERRMQWTGAGMGRILDVRAFLDALRPELERRIDASGLEAECHLHLKVDGTEHNLILCRSHHITNAAASVMVSSITCSSQSLLLMSLGVLPWRDIPGVEVTGTLPLVDALFPEDAPNIYAYDRF